MKETKKIKQKFFDSLKRGTGEAYIIARDNPDIDFSKYIIKGVLKNYAYDGQSEGSRADYIYDLIKISSKKDKIRKAVLKGLATEMEDTWTLVHLFDLAKLYAKQGDSEAKTAIFKRFFFKIINYADWAGYDTIIELDGLNGLIFIAKKIGRYLEQNPDNCQDDSIIQHFQDDNPSINAFQELELISISNKYVKIYLDYINDNKRTREENSRNSNYTPLLNYENLKEKIANKKQKFIFLPQSLQKNITQEEINKLADNFLKEKKISKKEMYLSIFSQIKYPYDYKTIYKLAKRKMSDKNRIAELALYSLKHLQAPKIRAFGLKKLKNLKSIIKNDYVDSYTNLLTNNYCEGDAKLLKSIAKKANKDHIIENLAGSYVQIYSANKTKECLAPILELYSKMNCALHRKYLIDILIENDVLPDYIYEEMEFDCNDEIRQLHKSLANKI
jgi:hypothetical protein